MLEVYLDRVRLNRNWRYTSYRLSPDILTTAAAEAQYKNICKMDAPRPQRAYLIPRDIDIERQTTSPRLLEGSGSHIGPAGRAMLGCIGVAPAGDEVVSSGPAGPYGGNMDYNDVSRTPRCIFQSTIREHTSTSKTATRSRAMARAWAVE